MSIPSVSKVLELPDTLLPIVELLGVADLESSALVCKLWRNVTHQLIWEKRSKEEGIPLVAGTKRDREEDFKFLYPITLNGKTIQQYFGRVDGEIPDIDAAKFNTLVTQDDPWQAGIKRHHTFEVIVSPAHIIRPYDQALFNMLAKEGDLAEILPTTGSNNIQEMRIPFGLKNRTLLAKYLFAKHANGPVIKYLSPELMFKFFSEPNPSNLTLTKTALYIMRKEVIGRDLSYVDQQKLVKTHHLEITPLDIRLLSNTVGILKFGTCPDTEIPAKTYARTSTLVQYSYDNRDCPMVIGGFVPAIGLDVSTDYFSANAHNYDGVATGIPAEVQTSEIGKGH